MNKLLKWVSAVVVALVLLLVAAIVLLTTVVSPNRFKPILTAQVMKYTGRVLTIDGDLSWSFFPYLGVKIGHTALGNPAQFKQKIFAEITSITVGVKLLPLLHGRVESSGIVLNGMKLNLVKNAAGEVNWALQISAAKPTTDTESTKSATNTSAAIGLAISAVDVADANASYVDEQTKQSYNITNFELHAKDINLVNPFPLTTAFDFAAKNPAASGHVTLSGEISLDLTAQVYSFRNAELTAKIKQGDKKIDMSLTGNLLADMKQQTVEWTDLKGKVENISLTGKINVTHVNTNPVATGQMQILPFDLKDTLVAMGSSVNNLQTANDVSGNVNFTAAANNVNVQGNFKIDTLKAANLTMKNFQVKALLQNGVLNLAPFSANFYQGTLDGQAKVNLNSPNMPLSLTAKLANIQAEPLMQDLGGANEKIKIIGTGNVSTDVTTTVADPAAVLRNLNGTGTFSFNNGAVTGIDLGYLVDSAYALATQKGTSPTDNNRTNFGNLTGTATIRNGVVSNNDLTSDSPRFLTKGQGTIDLVNQQINYQLQTAVKQRTAGKDNALDLYGISLPITITGSLSNPSIRLDTHALMKAVAEKQIEKVTDKAKEKIQEQLKSKVNEQAGVLLNNLLNR